MSDRDRLFELLGHVAFPETPEERDAAYSAIEAMLQPRTITTPDELASLPDGSLLMSGDRIKMYAGAVWRVRGGMVEMVGREARGVTPFKYFLDPLPTTVLHEPKNN